MMSPKNDLPVRTVGVEEELLLVHPRTLAPVALAESLLARDDRALRSAPEAADGMPAGSIATSKLVAEVKQEQLEVVSPPLRSLDDLCTAIRDGRTRADAAAQLVGARAVAMATCVGALRPHLMEKPRYRAMMTRFGLTMREQLTCGFHVHVSIESREEGVAVLDRIRVWLPVLLALSSNSPFWQGEDSGYSSYRYQAWLRWPSAGPTDRFGTPEGYDRVVNEMLASGVLLDGGMVYFDARLSSRYPTVEVRIADVCLEPAHAAVLAALVRSLAETASREWRDGRTPPDTSALQLRLASWRASRSGVLDDLIHPMLGVPRPARDVVAALLEHVDAALADDSERREVERVLSEIVHEGSGADRQRRVLRETGSLTAVVADALARTHSSGAAAVPGAMQAIG
jgi:glutamate---cysteine ligase / carboxylate-amine ligase